MHIKKKTEKKLKILFENKDYRQLHFVFTKNKHPELQELANKLLNLPVSSAQLKRVFYNYLYIHNSLQNHLNTEHSGKLLHLLLLITLKLN